jgi:hypothetical protein
MRRSTLVMVLAAASALAACGTGATPPEPVSADALPGEAGKVVELDTTVVASDAIDFEELGSLLDDAGFEGGTQRTFSQAEGARLQRSLARVLAFDDAEGAQRYLGWLEEHLDEVIGTSELLDPPALPGIAFFAFAPPGDCCPKATNVYLVAWRKGSKVLTLEVGGNGVNEAAVAQLASTLDTSVPA